MNQLIAAFAGSAIGGEQPMHGAGGAKILAFVDQGGVDLGRRRIAKTSGIQDIPHRLPLVWREGSGPSGPRRRSKLPVPVGSHDRATQQGGHFVLNIDNDFGFAQFFNEAFVLAA